MNQTIEVTGTANEKQLLRMRVVGTVERLDANTVNVKVEDSVLDDFTDWLDEQEEPYLTWRLI